MLYSTSDTLRSTNIASAIARAIAGDALDLKNDALKTLLEKSRKGGPMVPVRIGLKKLFLLNHPDLVEHVFKKNRHNYVKSDFYGRMRPLLGDGLFTLDGDEWRRQRAASQPAVSGVHLKAMASQMTAAIMHTFDSLDWHAKAEKPIEMTKFAVHLTLDIAMRTLFSSYLEPHEKNKLYDAFRYLLEYMEQQLWSPFPAPTWAPTNRARRFRRAMHELDVILYKIIDERLNCSSPPNDMLDGILRAESMIWHKHSRKSLRDQVLSILVASHETVASSLVWMMAILSGEQTFLKEAEDEVDNILRPNEPAGFDTVRQLTNCHNIFKEILRLCPPAWTFSRKAVEDDMLGDTKISKGTNLIICPYTLQRHAHYWEDPSSFNPHRFLTNDHHAYAYFPFAGGHHVCLGNRFAMIEGTLILAHLIQRYRFKLVKGQELVAVPTTTLRPKGYIYMHVKMRDAGDPL